MNGGQVRASELECQATVVAAAKLAGWRVHAQRAARTSQGWRTAVQGDSGFPDLVLARPATGELLVVELKRAPNRVEPAQQAWLDALKAVGVCAEVWWVPEQLHELVDRLGRRLMAWGAGQRAVDRVALQERLVRGLFEEPVGYRQSEEEFVDLPAFGHAFHRFDGRCAVCRSGDLPAAAAALVERICTMVDG